MTAQQIDEIIIDMRKFGKALSKSPELSRKFLVDAGICTPKGNLRKPYKSASK